MANYSVWVIVIICTFLNAVATVDVVIASSDIIKLVEIPGAFHLVKISGISGSAVNGTRFVGSSHWKIPRKSGKSKKVVPFSRLEFPNGLSCSIYVSRSLYQLLRDIYPINPRACAKTAGIVNKVYST